MHGQHPLAPLGLDVPRLLVGVNVVLNDSSARPCEGTGHPFGARVLLSAHSPIPSKRCARIITHNCLIGLIAVVALVVTLIVIGMN